MLFNNKSKYSLRNHKEFDEAMSRFEKLSKKLQEAENEAGIGELTREREEMHTKLQKAEIEELIADDEKAEVAARKVVDDLKAKLNSLDNKIARKSSKYKVISDALQQVKDEIIKIKESAIEQVMPLVEKDFNVELLEMVKSLKATSRAYKKMCAISNEFQHETSFPGSYPVMFGTQFIWGLQEVYPGDYECDSKLTSRLKILGIEV